MNLIRTSLGYIFSAGWFWSWFWETTGFLRRCSSILLQPRSCSCHACSGKKATSYHKQSQPLDLLTKESHRFFALKKNNIEVITASIWNGMLTLLMEQNLSALANTRKATTFKDFDLCKCETYKDLLIIPCILIESELAGFTNKSYSQWKSLEKDCFICQGKYCRLSSLVWLGSVLSPSTVISRSHFDFFK